MSKPVIPDHIVLPILEIIRGASGDTPGMAEEDSTHIILVAVKSGEPPVISSSIHPDDMVDVLQFLIDKQPNASFTMSDGHGNEIKTH